MPQNLRFTEAFKPEVDLVLKMSWTPNSPSSPEPDLLGATKDLFGVMSHFCSTIAHHVDGVPSTNHLLLEDVAEWRVYKTKSHDPKPDFRALWLHVLGYAGDTLLGVKSAEALFVVLVHVVLGIL